jgi:hypothetical protein
MTTWMDARVRWFRGSLEVQTAQSHAIMGTPCEVPVPRKITSMVQPQANAMAPAWQVCRAGDLLPPFKVMGGRVCSRLFPCRVLGSGTMNDQEK